jgi:hypothetical protein
VFAERFNRRLENKIYPIMTYRGEQIWFDVLDKVIEDYNNNTIQRTIKMTPMEGSDPENSSQIQKIFSDDTSSTKKSSLQKGNYVRIAKIKSIFAKAYTINWSYEIFQVDKVLDTNPWTYKIIDQHGEIIAGSWYGQELQKSLFGFENKRMN